MKRSRVHSSHSACLIGLVAALAGCSSQPSESDLVEVITPQIKGISCVRVEWPLSHRSPRRSSIDGPYEFVKIEVRDSELIQGMYRAGILRLDEERAARASFSIKPEFTGYFRDDSVFPEQGMFPRDKLHVCGLGESVSEITNITVQDEGDYPTATVEFEWEMAEPIPADWTFFPDMVGRSGGQGIATLDKLGDYWEVSNVQAQYVFEIGNTRNSD